MKSGCNPSAASTLPNKFRLKRSEKSSGAVLRAVVSCLDEGGMQSDQRTRCAPGQRRAPDWYRLGTVDRRGQSSDAIDVHRSGIPTRSAFGLKRDVSAR